MRRIGVSLFPGLQGTLNELLAYVGEAARLGCTKLFTSLHIPEADPDRVWSEGRSLFGRARELGMEVIADISPQTLQLPAAGSNPLTALADLGISGLRPDYGFDPAGLRALGEHPAGFELVLNATLPNFELWEEAGLDLAEMTACHNYYPRKDTGVSFAYFMRVSRQLKEIGMALAAFVPSQWSKRAPIYEGLPTIEQHRTWAPEVAAEHLFATGLVDTVYFGDPFASTAELKAVATVSQRREATVRVEAVEPLSDLEHAAIFGQVHRVREGEHEAVCEMGDDPVLHARGVIPPRNTVARPRLAVTVDNVLYGRYAGSMLIQKVDLPPDPRVNVVGHVAPQDGAILELLQAGDALRLSSVEEKR